MAVKKTPGGYTVRVGSTGVQRTFKLKKDADEYEAAQKRGKSRERAGMEPDKKPILYRELVELWTANYNPSPWKQRMLQHSLDRWGKTFVRSLQPEGIGAWLHGLTLAPKTKTHIIQAMRQVLNAGVEWGYLGRNPARPGTFQAPGSKRVVPIEPLEAWAEVEAVAEKMPSRWQAVVLFTCATGLRFPSEVERARWVDIDGQWSLSVRGTKTENAVRTIPLSKAACKALLSLPRPITKQTLIFGDIERSNFRAAWKKALEEAGLAYRNPYQMRHTFATLALQAGASLDDVAEMMGHSDIAITRRYYRKWTRPMADRLRGVLDTIGGENDASDQAAASADPA